MCSASVIPSNRKKFPKLGLGAFVSTLILAGMANVQIHLGRVSIDNKRD